MNDTIKQINEDFKNIEKVKKGTFIFENEDNKTQYWELNNKYYFLNEGVDDGYCFCEEITQEEFIKDVEEYIDDLYSDMESARIRISGNVHIIQSDYDEIIKLKELLWRKNK